MGWPPCRVFSTDNLRSLTQKLGLRKTGDSAEVTPPEGPGLGHEPTRVHTFLSPRWFAKPLCTDVSISPQQDEKNNGKMLTFSLGNVLKPEVSLLHWSSTCLLALKRPLEEVTGLQMPLKVQNNLHLYSLDQKPVRKCSWPIDPAIREAQSPRGLTLHPCQGASP